MQFIDQGGPAKLHIRDSIEFDTIWQDIFFSLFKVQFISNMKVIHQKIFKNVSFMEH